MKFFTFFYLPIFVLSLFACTPAKAPSARSVARSALITMAIAVKTVRATCADTADALVTVDPNNIDIAEKLATDCADATDGAKEAILDAAGVIDQMAANTPEGEVMPKVACLAKIVLDALMKTQALLKTYKVDVPELVVDGMSIADSLIPQCPNK